LDWQRSSAPTQLIPDPTHCLDSFSLVAQFFAQRPHDTVNDVADQDMAGVLTGGAAGTDTFSGEILNVITSTPELWEGEVQYQIHGTTHQFSAHIHVMENVVTNKATLDGVITEGWLHGRPVHGEYDTISSCPENPHQPPDPLSPCILVTLHKT
jgi:hypothetical protein